jgi:NTE family protein
MDNPRAISKAIVSLILLLMLLFIGCAHYPVNKSLLDTGPINKNNAILEAWRQSDRSDTLTVLLAFSGGGTRAAAFSYGVLEVLAETEIVWENRKRRLIDEVNTISSVSGGSFTAGYYGLFGDRIFDDFEDNFLKRDVQSVLIRKVLSPWNWFKLGSGHYGRSELSAEYYDKILFKGGTFGDIAATGGPLIRINATDAGFGLQFDFSPETFNALCSDLSEFSVARAVAASSAVPVLFSSLTVHNYAGTCGYRMPEWMQSALKEQDSRSRRYRLATHYAKYLDREQKPYIHLYDGGLSDNIGIRAYLNLLSLMGEAYTATKYSGFADTRRILFLVVNAQAELESKYDLNKRSLSLTKTIMSSSSIPLNEYTFESMTLLRRLIRQIEEQISEHRCADYRAQGKPTEGCEDIRVYVVDVNFDALPEEKDRKYLKHLSTSFRLKPEAVDKLRWAAKEILKNSSEFQRFLNELN